MSKVYGGIWGVIFCRFSKYPFTFGHVFPIAKESESLIELVTILVHIHLTLARLGFLGVCPSVCPFLQSATVAQWGAHSPRNTEDVGSNPGTGKYIVA